MAQQQSQRRLESPEAPGGHKHKVPHSWHCAAHSGMKLCTHSVFFNLATVFWNSASEAWNAQQDESGRGQLQVTMAAMTETSCALGVVKRQCFPAVVRPGGPKFWPTLPLLPRARAGDLLDRGNDPNELKLLDRWSCKPPLCEGIGGASTSLSKRVGHGSCSPVLASKADGAQAAGVPTDGAAFSG
eukprot:CAMPEP_0170310252 /NCGR_PEP_ID=MMETSP0116_2-20130129/55607_1 /TAXON_ID=400756 /ORGANISM="Durinskia baltica, Strain CSIRO CS-38" /LENGTH=185 /DNA_ID=CAMNT_0010562517 /DNA_START=88 /DNA_END=641 /DNA_ORIENTATION=-